MRQKYASIPTKYRGVQFRSRLEARWAAYFDILRWNWEYEPIDLNGWIPDFIIKGNTDLLVEIKYFSVFTSFPEVDERWEKQLRKIEKANPDYPVLLLSNTPIDNESDFPESCFGVMFEKYDDDWFFGGQEPNLSPQKLVWGSPCFISNMYPISYEPTYCVKGSVSTSLEGCSKDRNIEKWNEAGNLTQWNKPK